MKQTQTAPEGGSWRDRLSEWWRDSVHDLEQEVDRGWDRLTGRFGWNQPGSLQVYTGYANGKTVKLGCRVLAGDPQGGPQDDDGWWDNLLNSYRRWNTHELAGVEVLCHFRGQTHRATSDEEGYVWLEFPDMPRAMTNGGETAEDESSGKTGFWQDAEFEVLSVAVDPESGREARPAIRANCGVICPTGAALGVISDMDDTVLFSGVTSLTTMAKLTFLGNSKTRQPLAGIGALYRALAKGRTPTEPSPVGEGVAPGKVGRDADAGPPEEVDQDEQVNPVFYVSSSPWNLHDLLHDFLELNDIPVGPLRLRDLGVDHDKFIKSKGHGHKLVKARQIMDDFPDLPFILFGDSGQADAELYAALAAERAAQIKAVFIRDVGHDESDERDTAVLGHLNRTQAAGVPAMLIRDSTAAAKRLVELGLLDQAVIDDVRAAVELDEQQPTSAEAAAML